jgi:phenylacetate-CoA ligase
MKVKKVNLNPLRVYARLRFFKKSQFWDRETVEQYQLRQVKNIILHAGMNVPYYRSLFKSVGFDPQRFKYLKDIEQIPIARQGKHQEEPRSIHR